MQFTKQGVITAAEKAGCNVALSSGQMLITAPSGMVFPDGSSLITMKADAPEYDVIYPALADMAVAFSDEELDDLATPGDEDTFE